MSKLVEINVNLSKTQRIRIRNAAPNQTIIIRLRRDCLTGNDILHVGESSRIMLEERRIRLKGIDIKIFPKQDIEIKDNGDVYLAY